VFGTVVDWRSMVAAHPDDLRAAAASGQRAAYAPRPFEFGPGGSADPPALSFNLVAGDFVELAEQLGA
jgi:2-haloacid dehalogenase